MDNNDELLAEFREFRGQMSEFKNTCERRFAEHGLKLDAMSDMLASSASKIASVEKDVAVVEYKISNRDLVKIVASTSVIVVPLIELVKWVITRTL